MYANHHLKNKPIKDEWTLNPKAQTLKPHIINLKP
jgi:hypothetical protein